MEEFDIVVVGSDEVWNLTHPWYGGCRLFFGAGVSAQRLISYAASFGNYDANGGLDKVWADYLRRFSAVSVRDLNSQRIVTSALESSVPLVLDPCLQFPPRPPRETGPPKIPFLAIYGDKFSKTFVQRVRRFARSRNLRLLSVGYHNSWADTQRISASPEEFASIMANATCIATNFFHGCIFALKNRKPFVTELSTYRRNKILGLIEQLGAGKHLLAEDSPARACERCLWRTVGSRCFYSHRRAAGALELLLGPCSSMRKTSRDKQQIFSPKQIVHSGLCIGCGMCVGEGAGQMVFDRFGQYKPSGPRQWYRRPSREFSARCPFSPSASLIACASHTRGSSCASASRRMRRT